MVGGSTHATGVNVATLPLSAQHFFISYTVFDLPKGTSDKYTKLIQLDEVPQQDWNWIWSYMIDFTAIRDELQDRAEKALDYVLKKRDDDTKFWLMRQDTYVSAQHPHQEEYTAQICASMHWEMYCVSFAYADVYGRELYVPTTHELRVRIKAALSELEEKLAEADKKYREEEEARLSQHE